MLYANTTSQDLKELTQALNQSKNIEEYQRLHIIKLSSTRKTVPELAELFDRCAATIRDYIKRYNTGGLKHLQRRSSSGAPVQIPFNQAQWEALLHQSPSQFEHLNTVVRNWSQVLIVTYLHRYHRITVTRQAVAAHLKRHGIRLNRGRLKITSPDPLYTIKRDYLNALKKSPIGHA